MFQAGFAAGARAKITNADDGDLTLGNMKVGSVAMSSGEFQDSVTASLSGDELFATTNDDVLYTVYGSNRLLLTGLLRTNASFAFGNVMFYFGDGDPLAFGAFQTKIFKDAVTGSTSDWIRIAIDLNLEGISDKFNLQTERSTNFSVAEDNENILDAVKPRGTSLIVRSFSAALGDPAFAFYKDRWFVNSQFRESDYDFSVLSGGEAGDDYEYE